MKGLFKPKPRTPADIVRHTRELLVYIDLNANSRDPKREEKLQAGIYLSTSVSVLPFLQDFKFGHVQNGSAAHLVQHTRWAIVIELFAISCDSYIPIVNYDQNRVLEVLPDCAREPLGIPVMLELCKNIRELKFVLYGNSESEPVVEACTKLTQEFFRQNTLRLLIICLPKLNLEAKKDATQVVANLQRQQVQSRLIASDYLEANKDLLDILISGYENMDIALHYGAMLRECIRHQSVARYILESEHMQKFFDYIEIPNFDIASDVTITFKELLTRHKSTVAEFLSKNYDWFFTEFNSRLLSSPNYVTRRQAIKVLRILGDMLLDRSNSAVMVRYVSSKDNLMILMNLLRWNTATPSSARHRLCIAFAIPTHPERGLQRLVWIVIGELRRRQRVGLLPSFKPAYREQQLLLPQCSVPSLVCATSVLPYSCCCVSVSNKRVNLIDCYVPFPVAMVVAVIVCVKLKMEWDWKLNEDDNRLKMTLSV
ncbi:hypothetical protein ZIOFF_033026 [Zingiber officinale]|uniref:Mo25 family protein n=1 Tax=Zingiber officinale TaxID=94328 RepID=A0A8J5GPX1_ZINOF|nr:hypothetical protein ZIOFF_033026 [Zingiber officinale]